MAYSREVADAPEGIYSFDVSHSGHREPDSKLTPARTRLSFFHLFPVYLVYAGGGQIARKE